MHNREQSADRYNATDSEPHWQHQVPEYLSLLRKGYLPSSAVLPGRSRGNKAPVRQQYLTLRCLQPTGLMSFLLF